MEFKRAPASACSCCDLIGLRLCTSASDGCELPRLVYNSCVDSRVRTARSAEIACGFFFFMSFIDQKEVNE